MSEEEKKVNAVVTAVYPNKVRIAVRDLKNFEIAGEKLAVGSYIRISDHEDCAIIAVIDNYSIEHKEGEDRNYIIEANPIGFLDNSSVFHRGATNIAIPPIKVEPAKKEEIRNIYAQIEKGKEFCFASLSQDSSIRVPVNGDSFFNKHIAIVGSTGSGKSHTVASILQKAIASKEGEYKGLNNSHVVVFDLHGEYDSAFPEANLIDVTTLKLPYWAMNEEELEELLIERGGDNQAYNQTSLLRKLITLNKSKKSGREDVTFGTPVPFSMEEVVRSLANLANETVNYLDNTKICLDGDDKDFSSEEEKYSFYFSSLKKFKAKNNGRSADGVKAGTYNDGSLSKFINRLNGKKDDDRLKFLFDEDYCDTSLKAILEQLLAYTKDSNANVTVIDLSGIPFEVLSITVSLITRLIFEYGYYFKRFDMKQNADTPILLVYEEAHKYVPKSGQGRYTSCRRSIERIAKEGRKYGVTLSIISQRPSEISETIFSQCNNFVAMRLTNPEDQNYGKRLLPDSLGPLTESLPTLAQGEALLIGEAVVMPSLVKIDRCPKDREPSSQDMDYYQEWKKKWESVDFNKLADKWTGGGGSV